MDCGLRIAEWLCLVAILTFGCDARPTSPPRPATVYGTATIKGFVHFPGKSSTSSEAVIVDPHGGLANVFISIEGLPASDGSTLPPVTMDQVLCQFVPHVIAAAVGQKVVFHSSDQTLHNVTYSPAKNPAKNFAMSEKGAASTTSFNAGEYIHVKCDVHPWMNGWVGVFENPFFAVTNSDGAFEIDKIPAGTYKLVAWHEQYGRMDQSITVQDGKTVETKFEYAMPK